MRDAPAVVPAVVLWDADGVLQDRAEGDEGVHRRFAEIVGLDRADADALLDVAFEAERPCLRGEGDWPAALRDVLAGAGVADRADDVLALWCDSDVLATPLSLALRVREQGPRCYLASNQTAARAAAMEQRVGYGRLLDGAFYSYALGAAKPDLAYFDAVLERLGVPAEAVWFVDDRADNVEAAAARGLRGVRWTHREGTANLAAVLREGGLAL